MLYVFEKKIIKTEKKLNRIKIYKMSKKYGKKLAEIA